MSDGKVSPEEAARQVAMAMKGLGEVSDEAAKVFWDIFANGELKMVIGAEPEKPNNWLKMHGYPMRRKGGRKKC